MPKAIEGENDLPPPSELRSLSDMSGKVALVTGGGSGIGAMISAGFVANNATVYIVSRKDTSPYARLLTEAYPGQAVSLRADITKQEDVAGLVAELKRRAGKLHVLVNNSGTNWAQPVDEYELSGWDKVYNLNTRAVFHMSQQFLPLLDAAATSLDPARIINISSIDAIQIGALDTFAYSSGKAAVSHLTRVMAGKLGKRHITVNAIQPGAFASRMMRATLAAAGEEIAKGIPLGRIGGVHDMAGVALMLAGRAGAWMTGACITLDGGAVVRPRL